MHQSQQVPQQSEGEPGSHKRGAEQNQFVPPLHVHKGGPGVTQVQSATPTHILDADVAPPILG